MASYTSRTYEERRITQRLWEAGVQVKEIADKLDAPLSSIYSELRRGQDGSRLPNQRLCYNAERNTDVVAETGRQALWILLITANPEFFTGKSLKEIATHFQRAAGFIIDRVGRETIISAVVHMRENAPPAFDLCSTDKSNPDNAHTLSLMSCR